MKTSELTGAALDWAVALAEGYTADIRLNKHKQWEDLGRTQAYDDDYTYWSPSTDWAQGGPIIEREGIDLYCNVATNPSRPDKPWRGSWRARYCRMGYGTEFSYGATALEAAMRCYVASKLGDEVEIPGGLQ